MCTGSIFVQDNSRYLSVRIMIVEGRKWLLLKGPPQFPAETEDRGRTGFRNIVSFLVWDEGKVQNFSHDYVKEPSDSTKWGEFIEYLFLRKIIVHRVCFPFRTRLSPPTLSKWYDIINFMVTPCVKWCRVEYTLTQCTTHTPLRVTICSHSTDDPLHIFHVSTLNLTCNF